MTADEIVPSLIGSIYEAAIDPGRWDEVLASVRAAFGAESVLLWRRGPSSTRAAVVCAVGLPDGLDWRRIAESPSCRARLRAYEPLAVLEADEIAALLPLGERAFEELPVQWREQHEAERGLVVALLRDPDHLALLEIVRSRGSDPFDVGDWDLARCIAPHLARAIVIERERERSRIRGAAAAALGERLPMGVILVDGDATLIDCSRRANEILEEGDGLYCDSGRLSAANRSERERLLEAIGWAAGSARGAAMPESLALSVGRRTGRSPLSIEVARVAGGATRGGLLEPQALVYVKDPDRGTGISTEALRRTFGLTRTEAEVTARIARGLNHGEAARELGVSVCAVRFHLKNIYAKTATQRQAELVYLLASGSARLAG
jgi:DNA-binding CsgD family transcriptional regulator